MQQTSTSPRTTVTVSPLRRRGFALAVFGLAVVLMGTVGMPAAHAQSDEPDDDVQIGEPVVIENPAFADGPPAEAPAGPATPAPAPEPDRPAQVLGETFARTAPDRPAQLARTGLGTTGLAVVGLVLLALGAQAVRWSARLERHASVVNFVHSDWKAA